MHIVHKRDIPHIKQKTRRHQNCAWAHGDRKEPADIILVRLTVQVTGQHVVEE